MLSWRQHFCIDKNHPIPLSCQLLHVPGPYLERQACAEHQDKDKFKVLIDGPQGLHSTVSICHEEIQRRRRQYLIREEQPAAHRFFEKTIEVIADKFYPKSHPKNGPEVEENGGAKDDRSQQILL